MRKPRCEKTFLLGFQPSNIRIRSYLWYGGNWGNIQSRRQQGADQTACMRRMLCIFLFARTSSHLVYFRLCLLPIRLFLICILILSSLEHLFVQFNTKIKAFVLSGGSFSGNRLMNQHVTAHVICPMTYVYVPPRGTSDGYSDIQSVEGG